VSSKRCRVDWILEAGWSLFEPAPSDASGYPNGKGATTSNRILTDCRLSGPLLPSFSGRSGRGNRQSNAAHGLPGPWWFLREPSWKGWTVPVDFSSFLGVWMKRAGRPFQPGLYLRMYERREQIAHSDRPNLYWEAR
jgi:hypothetical protein